MASPKLPASSVPSRSLPSRTVAKARNSDVAIISPGGRLIRELGKLIPADGPPDPAAVAELFARYDTEMVESAPTGS